MIEISGTVVVISFFSLIFFLLGYSVGSLMEYKDNQKLKSIPKCPKCNNLIETDTEFEQYEVRKCTVCKWKERKEVKD